MTSPSRDLNYRLQADPSSLERGFGAAGRSGSALQRAMERVAESEERVNAEAAKVGQGLRAAGASMDGAGRDAGQLGLRIAVTTERLRRMARALDEVTDEAARVDLEKAFRGETQALARLKRIQAQVDELGDEARETSRELAEVGVSVGVRAGGAVATLFSRSIASPLAAGLAGAVAAASPIIAATIGAAVVTGLASAGVAAGLAGAFQDPRVKAAAADLGREVKADFLDASEVFVEPTIAAMAKLRQEWRSVRPEVEATLDAAARLVDPLAEGAAQFVARMLPGIRRAVQEAGPLVDTLSEDLPRIGDAIGDVFSGMAEDSEQTARALHDVLTTTRVLVVATGEYLNYLGDIYAIWREFILVNPMSLFSDQDRLVGQGQVGIVRDLRGEVQQSTGTLQTHVEVLEHVADAYRAAFGLVKSVEQAEIGFQRALDDLTGSVREHGTSLDAGTEKGRANREALLNLADAAVFSRDANLRNGMSVEAARARFEAQRATILALARSLRLSAAETQALINKLLGIPTSRTSTVKVKFVSDLSSWAPPTGGLGVGPIRAFQHGGEVTGPPGIDRTLIAATAGEFVSTVAATARNRAALEAANSGARLMVAPAGGPVTATVAGGTVGGPAGVDYRQLAREFARAVTGVTIRIDDAGRGRIDAVNADRLARGG